MKVVYVYIRDFIVSVINFQELGLDRLISFLLYLSVFLIPLFFIPLSPEFLEFSKVLFFYGLVILTLLIWLIKIFMTKKIKLQWHFLDGTIVILLFVYFLSSLFGVDRYVSFIGSNLLIGNSFVTFFFLVIFYFLVSRFLSSYRQIIISFYAINSAIFIILAVKLIQFFSGQLLSFDFGINITSFNFLLLLGSILSGLLFLISRSRKIKIFNLLLLVIFLATLFLIDNQYVLLVLSLSIFIFILLLSLKSAYLSNKLVVGLTLLIFIAVLIIILPVSSLTGIISPKEFDLPFNFGWQITAASLKDNFLLGVGPQNFIYSFYKYKPVIFNQTNYWQLGFEHNSNFWLESLNNLGVLAVILLLIIFGNYFYRLVKFLQRAEKQPEFYYDRLLVHCGLGVIIFNFFVWTLFYNLSFILWLLLFFFLAIGADALGNLQEEKILFSNKILLNLGFYFILILVVCFVYLGGKLFLGEIYLEKFKQVNLQSEANYEQAEKFLQSADSYNPYLEMQKLQLSNLLVQKVVFLSNNGLEYDKDFYKEKILSNIESALQEERYDVVYYQNLQVILNSLKNLGVDVADGLKMINEKLIALDPNDPELYIDRALINFNKYSLIKSNQLTVEDLEQEQANLVKKIKTDLEKSLELKSNYLLAYYNLGLLAEELNDENQSLEYMQKAYTINPEEKLVVLSLKKLYLNQDKVQSAIDVLGKYLEAQPNDIEVRLELAKIYKDTDKIKAKEEINRILELDPNNEEAKTLSVL
jgi:O-antigen ligase